MSATGPVAEGEPVAEWSQGSVRPLVERWLFTISSAAQTIASIGLAVAILTMLARRGGGSTMNSHTLVYPIAAASAVLGFVITPARLAEQWAGLRSDDLFCKFCVYIVYATRATFVLSIFLAAIYFKRSVAVFENHSKTIPRHDVWTGIAASTLAGCLWALRAPLFYVIRTVKVNSGWSANGGEQFWFCYAAERHRSMENSFIVIELILYLFLLATAFLLIRKSLAKMKQHNIGGCEDCEPNVEMAKAFGWISAYAIATVALPQAVYVWAFVCRFPLWEGRMFVQTATLTQDWAYPVAGALILMLAKRLRTTLTVKQFDADGNGKPRRTFPGYAMMGRKGYEDWAQQHIQ